MNFRLVKKQSKKTYIGKDKKERHYYNYYLVVDNGVSICIRPSFSKDNVKLDMVATYEK